MLLANATPHPTLSPPGARGILVLTFDQDVDPEKVAAKGAFLPQVTDPLSGPDGVGMRIMFLEFE